MSETSRKFFKHIRILSDAYQVLGVLLMLSGLILPILAGIYLAQRNGAWNEVLPLIIAAIFGCLLALGSGGFFAYVGYALRKHHRYRLARIAAIILLVLSILSFLPLAVLAIYTLIVLKKDALAKADDSSTEPAPHASSKNKSESHFQRLWWLFLVLPPVCLLFGSVFGAAWSILSTPKQYEARAVIEIRSRTTDSEETREPALHPGDSEWKSRLYAVPVVDRVVNRLDLARTWSVDERRARHTLYAVATFPVIPDTNLRELRIRHRDAEESVAIANAWALALKEWCLEQNLAETIGIAEKATTSERLLAPNILRVIFTSGAVGMLIAPLLAFLLIEDVQRGIRWYLSVPAVTTILLLVVLLGVIGLLLSPLVVILIIQANRRGIRWLLRVLAIVAGIIALLALALYATISIQRHLAPRNDEPAMSTRPPGFAPAPESTPEYAAFSFMAAIRDGDIDAALKWMDGGDDESFIPNSPTAEEDGNWLRQPVQGLSDKLRQEDYAGELEKLTQFVQWLPERRDANARYIATRVAAPSDPDEQGMKNGIYLILVSKPEGWRVLSFIVGDKQSFEDRVAEFLQQRLLALPVTPPLTMPEESPLTTDQVKDVLEGVTWGEFLAALAGEGRAGEISVKSVLSPDGNGRLYAVTFPYGNTQMLMNLQVDWHSGRAEPAGLRPAGQPDKALAAASEFLPHLAIRYAMVSDHPSGRPAAEQAKTKARQFQDLKTLKRYSTALAIYQTETGSYPPDLATLLDGDFPGKKRWEELQEHGLMHNHQTGKMERPIYYGGKDLEIDAYPGHGFILLAAPSAEPDGKRLVSFLDGSIKIIDEEEYQKQITEQALAANGTNAADYAPATGTLKRTVKALSPYLLELDGKTDTLYLRGDALKEIPDGARIRVEGPLRTELYDNSDDPTPAMPMQWHIYMDVKECRPIEHLFDSATPGTSTTHVAISVTPDGLWFNSRSVSLEELDTELKQWPSETTIEITADPTLDHQTVMAILDVCRKAEKSRVVFRSGEPSQQVFACRFIHGKYTMEHPLNAGSDVVLSERHVANAAIEGEGDKATLIVTLNDAGQEELLRLAREMPAYQYLAVFLGGEPVPAEAVSQDPKTGVFIIKLNSLSVSQVEQAKTFAKFISGKSVKSVNTFAKGKWSGMTADQVRESPGAQGGNINLPFDEPVYLHFRAVEKQGKDQPEEITLDYWVGKPATNYDITVLVEDIDSKYRLENEVIKGVSVKYRRIDRERIDSPDVTGWKMNDTGGGMGRTFKMAGDSISWRQGWHGGQEWVTIGKPELLYELYDGEAPMDNFRRMTVEFARNIPEDRQQFAFHQVIRKFLAACRQAEVDSPEAMEKQLGLDILRQREAEGEDMEKADRRQWHPVLREIIERNHPYEAIKQTYIDQPSPYRKEAILLLKVMGYKCAETEAIAGEPTFEPEMQMTLPPTPTLAAMVSGPVVLPSVLANRVPSARAAALAKYGGSEETESAVLRALRWLTKNQQADGSWGKTKPAMTALALLAYLGHGETLSSPEFGPVVESGLRFLIDAQELTGHFKGRDGHDYTHPIATYALAEAYAMTGNATVKEAAVKALTVIVNGQNPSGGFNYNLVPSTRDDTSYMAWCVQALAAGKMAGLSADVDGLDRAMEKAVNAFRGNYGESDGNGGFGYTGPSVSSGLSGAGAYSMQLLGEAGSKEVQNTLPTIARDFPFDWETPKGRSPLYYWYYNTQALFHKGGDAWDRWNQQFSSALVEAQNVEGHEFTGYLDQDGHLKKLGPVGYWTSPTEREHNGGNGEVMDTILCTLMLEVYYRYVPISEGL